MCSNFIVGVRRTSLRIDHPVWFALLGMVSLVAAQDLPPLDALARSTSHPNIAASHFSHAPLDTYRGWFEDRLDLPTFLTASTSTPRLAGSLLVADPEHVARDYLKSLASVYRIHPDEIDALTVFGTQRFPDGAAIVQFKHVVGSVEVFRERASVLLAADGSLIAIGGFISGIGNFRANDTVPFQQGPADAVASAVADFLAGTTRVPPSLVADGENNGYTRVIPVDAAHADVTFLEPAHCKPVLFRVPGGLIPAHFVKVSLADRDGVPLGWYSYVIAARDGSTLFRENLRNDAQAYSYRVFAETTPPYFPSPGPQGRNDTPNPTAAPDGYQAPFVAPDLIALQNGPISTDDPWLPDNATVTTGNNVDAFADLTPPFGFNAGDVRPDITAPNTFDRAFDPTLPPNQTIDQTKAAVTQAFYIVNWLHDWYYDAGFAEVDGNAQSDNYGRGGLEGDPIIVHAEYFGCFDDAETISTPDGISPIIVACAAETNYGADASRVTTMPDDLDTTDTGWAQFGPQVFAVTSNVVYADPPDACTPLVNAAQMAGAIALVDVNQSPAGCFYMPQAANAQAAGAVAVLFANTEESVNNMGDLGSPVSTLPALMVSLSAGNIVKNALIAGPLTSTLERVAGPLIDIVEDETVIAHEWTHYLSQRLIFDAAGLTNNQGFGMGEGWSDFDGALVFPVEEEDQYVPSDPEFNGTYAEAGYALSGTAPVSWAPPNTAYYYGFRRYPYSTNFAKNPLTYRFVADGVALPTDPPPHVLSDGDNAEAHNTGEIWASALWECYSALLRDSGRLTFAQAQDRMKRYLVAGFKLTPAVPTFVEARDALLAAMLARDPTDFELCAAGFARRGLGAGALPPTDRFGTDNAGVVESFTMGATAEYAGATLAATPDDDCDGDGVLDNGESGTVTVQVRNSGFQALTQSTLTVSSQDDDVILPQPTFAFPAIQPLATGSVAVPIELSGAKGIVGIALNLSLTDPALTGPLIASAVFRVNSDNSPSQSEDFESTQFPWTTVLELYTDPAIEWARIEHDPFTHDALGPDVGIAGATWMESPPLEVSASESLTFTFRHKFQFEFYPDNVDPNRYDGGVIEISTDGGNTWNDLVAAGGTLDPPYNGTLVVYAGNLNPLEGRVAYVTQNPSWPDFDEVTADLGLRFAGQTVQIRFGIGADNEIGAYGWEIDDISFHGVHNAPFFALVADPGHCVLKDTIFSDGFDGANGSPEH